MIDIKAIVASMTDLDRFVCISEWDNYQKTNRLPDDSAIGLAVDAWLAQLPPRTILFSNAVNQFMLEVFRYYAERYIGLLK